MHLGLPLLFCHSSSACKQNKTQYCPFCWMVSQNWSERKVWPRAEPVSHFLCREITTDKLLLHCYAHGNFMPSAIHQYATCLKKTGQSFPYHLQHELNLKFWPIFDLKTHRCVRVSRGLSGTTSTCRSPQRPSSHPASKARGRNCALTCGGPVKSSRLGWKLLKPDASPWPPKSAWCCRAVVHCR